VSTRYIGRLAPSPTGLLHLGHAATFYTAYTRARERNGTLLLRNEDLDPQRSRSEYVDAMLEDLAWLGIEWQPPMLSQSERLPAYRTAFDQLLAAGHIYPCSCSRKELARIALAPHEDIPSNATHPDSQSDDEPLYSGRCRPGSPATTLVAGVSYRFRVPDGETIRFVDRNLGPQAFTAFCDPASISPKTSAAKRPTANAFGDFLIWRRPVSGEHLANMSDIGLPSYQLACVVDDAHQRITEVVRGADLLKSTARQILLQRAQPAPSRILPHQPAAR
jgi:glutamyl/glutaminyl-tRNA synthetase